MKNTGKVKDELFSEPEGLIIAGSDEAGRGPLAGPVVAATVVLPDDFPFSVLNDSKKMNEAKRLEAEVLIKEKALSYAVSVIDHITIDRINILQASLLGMEKSFAEVYSKMDGKIDLLLVDGNKTPSVCIPVNAVVKGDSKVPAIMAASILAKNERDRIMRSYAKFYPGYGFEHHFGYPTKEHYEAIKKIGITPIHRLSFKLYKDDGDPKQPTLF